MKVQVTEAEMFVRFSRQAIDKFEGLMQVSSPDKHGEIREILRELAGKVREGARVQAIGEVSLEVAAPLYLIFKVTIPVM